MQLKGAFDLKPYYFAVLNLSFSCHPLGLTTSVDDEYRWAGVEDPKIMITTARDPSSKLKQFAKVILNRISILNDKTKSKNYHKLRRKKHADKNAWVQDRRLWPAN